MTSPNFVAFLKSGTNWDSLIPLFPEGVPIKYFLPSAQGGDEPIPCYEVDTDRLDLAQIAGIAAHIQHDEPGLSAAAACAEVINGIGLLHYQIAHIEWMEGDQLRVMRCGETSPVVPSSPVPDAIAVSLDSFIRGLNAALD